MKSTILLLVASLLSLHVLGQGNRKPKIVGQDPLSTNEEQSLTIPMSSLDVEDSDDWFYPWGFTMTIYPGSDYAVSGHAVTPGENFTGSLKVQVTVNDGENESNRFDLEITVLPVNDRPVITGHTTVTTNENQAVTIHRRDLSVSDPDNDYPDDFTLTVEEGDHYSVQGNTITPDAGFSGSLSVTVKVNDGQADSDPYLLPVAVKPVNRVPEITGQVALQVNEDESITIRLSDLAVTDNDSNYPEGFTLHLSPGNNYTVTNTTVKPAADFSGKLTVPVTVNDGKNTSQPFNLSIAVTPVNDIPRISDLETDPLFYGAGGESLAITETANVIDVDGDSIMFASVTFRSEGYQQTADKLLYTPAEHTDIRGVFDADRGVLTLLGRASPASYAAALRSVYFQTLVPNGADKVLSIVVNDGKAESEAAERTLLFGEVAVSLDIPSGFTPNGDLSNDTWKIIPLKSEEAYAHARIRVYNKAGILVYESNGIASEWDGRMNGQLLPADTYFYTIDLNTNTPEGYVKGIVTILR